MSGRKVDVGAIREKLFGATNGGDAHDQLDRLLRADPELSIPVLMDYATKGSIDHVRTSAVARLVKLVPKGGTAHAGFFEAGLSDPALAYWSLEGLARTAGRASYPALARFALDDAQRTEARGKAIREVALVSGQDFARGLGPDPGHWRESDLPIGRVEAWAAAGFPDGAGFAPPARHPSLDAPQTALDQLASRLEAKLAKIRAKGQDPMNPSNWLVPASPGDLSSVEARWKLPAIYLEFLRKFSPLKVNIESRRHYQGLDLYGAADLLAAQNGYSFNPVTQEPIDGWPEAYVVVANHAGDPYVMDLSSGATDDAPILTASHDEPAALIGDRFEAGWRFKREAPSFYAFLERLCG